MAETHTDASRLLYDVGRALWHTAATAATAATGSEPGYARRALFERMAAPRPGDLVIEVSSFGGYDADGVGRLLRIEDEGADPRYVVAPLHSPDVEQGWRNAEFVALPEGRLTAWTFGAQRES